MAGDAAVRRLLARIVEWCVPASALELGYNPLVTVRGRYSRSYDAPPHRHRSLVPLPDRGPKGWAQDRRLEGRR